MGGAQGSLKITFPKSPELKKVVSIYHLTPVQVEQMYQIFTVMYKKLNHGRAPTSLNLADVSASLWLEKTCFSRALLTWARHDYTKNKYEFHHYLELICQVCLCLDVGGIELLAFQSFDEARHYEKRQEIREENIERDLEEMQRKLLKIDSDEIMEDLIDLHPEGTISSVEEFRVVAERNEDILYHAANLKITFQKRTLGMLEWSHVAKKIDPEVLKNMTDRLSTHGFLEHFRREVQGKDRSLYHKYRKSLNHDLIRRQKNRKESVYRDQGRVSTDKSGKGDDGSDDEDGGINPLATAQTSVMRKSIALMSGGGKGIHDEATASSINSVSAWSMATMKARAGSTLGRSANKGKTKKGGQQGSLHVPGSAVRGTIVRASLTPLAAEALEKTRRASASLREKHNAKKKKLKEKKKHNKDTDDSGDSDDDVNGSSVAAPLIVANLMDKKTGASIFAQAGRRGSIAIDPTMLPAPKRTSKSTHSNTRLSFFNMAKKAITLGSVSEIGGDNDDEDTKEGIDSKAAGGDKDEDEDEDDDEDEDEEDPLAGIRASIAERSASILGLKDRGPGGGIDIFAKRRTKKKRVISLMKKAGMASLVSKQLRKEVNAKTEAKAETVVPFSAAHQATGADDDTGNGEGTNQSDVSGVDAATGASTDVSVGSVIAKLAAKKAAKKMTSFWKSDKSKLRFAEKRKLEKKEANKKRMEEMYAQMKTEDELEADRQKMHEEEERSERERQVELERKMLDDRRVAIRKSKHGLALLKQRRQQSKEKDWKRELIHSHISSRTDRSQSQIRSHVFSQRHVIDSHDEGVDSNGSDNRYACVSSDDEIDKDNFQSSISYIHGDRTCSTQNTSPQKLYADDLQLRVQNMEVENYRSAGLRAKAAEIRSLMEEDDELASLLYPTSQERARERMNEYHQIRRNSVEAEAVEVAKRAVEEFYSQHGRTRSNLSISKGSTGRNKERKRGGKGDGTGRHASMSMDTRSRHSTPLQQHRSPGCLSAQPKPGGDDGENLQSLPFAAFFEQEEDNPPSPPPSDNHRYQQGQPGVVCASSSPQAVFYRLDANTSTSFAKDTEYSSNTRSHGSHPSARAHSGINTSLDLDTSMESSPASRVGVGARAALRRMAEEDGKRKSGLGRNMSEDGYRENKRGRRDYTRIKSRHQDRGELDGSLNSIGGRSHRSPPPTDLAPTRQRYYSPNTRINKSMHSNSNSILHLNASATIDVDQYAKRLVGDDHVGITVSDHLVRPHDRSRMDQHNRRQICRDNHLTVMVDQMNDYHRRIQFDVEAGNFRPHQKARMYREQKKQQERKQRKQEKEHKYNETKTMLASVSSPSLLLQTSYKLNPANAYGEGSQKSGKRQLVAVMDAIDRLEANTSNISFYQLIQQRAKEEERKEREERERREAGRKKKEKPRINYGSLPPKPSVTIKTTQLDRLNIDSKTINKKAANKAQLLADRYSRSQFSMKHPDKQGYLLRTKHEDYLHNMNYEERMRISENVRDYYLIVFQFDIIPFKNKSGTEDEKEQEMEDFLANATVAQLREVDCNLMEKLEMIKAEEEVLNQRARIRGKVKGTISGLKRKNRKGKERTERGKTIIGAKPAESLTGTAGSSLSAAGKMMVKLSSTQREGQTLNISSLSALVNSVSEKRRAESRNTALSSGSAPRGRGGMRSNLAMALRRMPGGKQEEEEDDSDGDGGGGKKGSGKGQTRTQSLQRMETVIGEIRKKNRKRLRSKGSSSKADIKKASVLALARQSMAAMALANAPKGE